MRNIPEIFNNPQMLKFFTLKKWRHLGFFDYQYENDDVQDVAQGAWLEGWRAAQRWKPFKKGAKLESFVWGRMHGHTIDHLRRKGKLKPHEQLEGCVRGISSGDSVRAILDISLKHMPEQVRTIFDMKVQGYSAEDISEFTKLGLSHIYKQIKVAQRIYIKTNKEFRTFLKTG